MSATTETNGPVVSIGNLHKRFGDNHVLRGIDLDVVRGEVVCIIEIGRAHV